MERISYVQIEPESIETAIVQNIIWNSINNANGICGLNWSLTANPTCCSPIKSKFPIKAFPVPKLNENPNTTHVKVTITIISPYFALLYSKHSLIELDHRKTS